MLAKKKMNETQTTVWMQIDGEQPIKLQIAVGVPESDPLSDKGDMRTAVSLTPVISQRWIHGVNAIQSLSLAVHFVVAAVRALETKGYSFSLEANGSQIDLAEILTGCGWGALEEEIANKAMDDTAE
jgi:hypothetical protein